MTGASETGGQFRVIKVIMYNWVASAVTMRENTHWVQAGAQSEALPGRQCKMSYISQNIYFEFFSNFVNVAWWARSALLWVSVHRPIHYTTGEGVFNSQSQGYFKIPRF